jgi:hypothetical protein
MRGPFSAAELGLPGFGQGQVGVHRAGRRAQVEVVHVEAVSDGPGVHLGFAQATGEPVDAGTECAVELAEDVGAPVLQVKPAGVDLVVPAGPALVEQGRAGGGSGGEWG